MAPGTGSAAPRRAGGRTWRSTAGGAWRAGATTYASVLGLLVLAGLAAAVGLPGFADAAVAATASGWPNGGALDWLASLRALATAGWQPLSLGLVGAAAAGGEDDDVERLIDGVRSLADGDRDVAFDVDRDDDVGRLADALDDLADDLAEREATDANEAADANETADAHGGTDARAAAADDLFAAVGESVRRLETAETDAAVARAVCSIVDEELDEPLCMLWTYEADEARLVPAASTDAAGELFDAATGGEPAVLPADGAEMELFRAGEPTVVEDYGALDGATYPDASLGTVLTVPVDGSGLLAVGYREVTDVDPATRDLVEVLARHAGAALERVEREQRLARYKEFTDDVMNAIDEVFYVVGEDRTFQRWNDNLEDVSGYDAEEVASMEPGDFVVEADRDAIERKTEALFEGDASDEPDAPRTEARVRTKDGEVIPYEFTGGALEAPDGERVVVGIGRDVSRRKERERMLEALVENTQDPIYIKDREGRYTFVNQAMTDYLGSAAEAVIGATDHDIFEAESADVARADDEQVIESGEPLTDEVVHTIDDEDLVFHDHKYPYRDEDDEVVGVMGISRDITERKRRERELGEREQELSRLVRNVPGMVYRARNDPEWPMEFVSDGAAELTGYDAEQLESGEVVWGEDVIADYETEWLWEAVQEAVDEREPFRVTYPIETADGERRWLKEQGRGVYDEEGELEHLEGVCIDVTDRVANERELEARTAAMEATIDGIAILDEDQEYTYVNQAHADVYGYDDPEAFVGETWRMCYPEAERDRLESEVFFELAEVGSWRGEAEGLRADGTTFPQELSLTMLDDGRMICVVRDVTERKQRERELERTTDLLRVSEQLADMGGWSSKLEGEPPYEAEWTDNLYELFELPPEEGPPTDDLFEYYHPEDRDRHLEAVERAIEEGEPWDQEIRLLTAEGEQRWVRNIGRPVLEGGEAVELYGVLQDVTERKEREREIEETNARLGAVFEASPAAVVAIDPDGEVQLWNPAAEEIFGWTEAEVVGDPVPFVPDRKRAEFEELRERLFDGESITNYETVRVTKDGSEVDVSLSVAPLRDDEGDVVGAMSAILDVSERKAYEAELERTTELLKQAQYVADVGGWELDLRSDPPEMTWADQLYDIHDVPRDTEIDLETALEFYHPEDRDRVERIITEAIEEGEAYDMEVRLSPNGEDVRWVRAIGQPVWEGDQVVALRGSIQDITDHKRREREIERTRDLLQQAQRMGSVGGWELDVSERPYEGVWTDQLFEIFETEPRESFSLDELFEFVHPRERDWVRAEITRGIESGEPFSLEHRIVTDGGDERWVRLVAEPVNAGEDVYRGAILDVTAQKEREVILESLHETARGLLQTQSAAEVAELAIETAGDVLDAPCSAIYLLDDESGHLEPVAFTDAFDDHCGGPNASTSSDGSSLLWEAYVSEAATTLSESAVEEPGIFETEIREAVYVPIGDHGVFVAASPSGPIDPDTRRVAETLVATMEAALHRLDSENDLREREAELEARNRRLRRQIQINEIIRMVDQSLIGASSREEIETAVCERLTEADDVAFAWIGTLDSTEGSVVPRAWAGTSHDYLDAISLQTSQAAADPAVQTATTGAATVVESVVQEVKTEEWRKHALVSNFSSAVAVPIALDEYTYGVLGVYGTEPEQFGDLERDVFDELGESIANSINAVETRQALYADTFVELTIRLADSEDFLARVARETGGRAEYVGLGTHSEDESRVFFQVADADPEAVVEMLESTVSVGEHRRIGDGGEGHLFEATVSGDVLAAHLVRRGGVPRSMTATPGQLEVTVDVPASINVREFVETLREQHPSAELVSRRDVERDVETRQELVSSLFDDLTDRQIEVLRTAYFAGFFDWPRESTGEEIAELLDVSQPTVNRHVRHGLNRLLEQLFEEEPATIAGAH